MFFTSLKTNNELIIKIKLSKGRSFNRILRCLFISKMSIENTTRIVDICCHSQNTINSSYRTKQNI
jgi:hypothetical protein